MRSEELYSNAASQREDAPVLSFLSQLPNTHIDYLEAGSGVGRFPKLLKNINQKIVVTCIEINDKLASDLRTDGINVILGDVRKMPFKNEEFDVVHCSHLIEHFGYPDIATVLNELFRVTKTNGYVIIRSPLMHPNFYNDLDHVRPYPPKSILQHFANPQQQKVGGFNIKLVENWPRRQAKEINLSFPGSWRLNQILKIMWTTFNWPRGKADGYVVIFQKI